MDLTTFLTDHALLLAMTVCIPTAFLFARGTITRHQYAAVNAVMFAALTYLAFTAGHWIGGTWYAVVAGTMAWLYHHHRPRAAPLDGSHEAL